MSSRFHLEWWLKEQHCQFFEIQMISLSSCKHLWLAQKPVVRICIMVSFQGIVWNSAVLLPPKKQLIFSVIMVHIDRKTSAWMIQVVIQKQSLFMRWFIWSTCVSRPPLKQFLSCLSRGCDRLILGRGLLKTPIVPLSLGECYTSWWSGCSIGARVQPFGLSVGMTSVQTPLLPTWRGRDAQWSCRCPMSAQVIQ